MCKVMEELRDEAFEEGREEGSEEMAIIIARDMLQSGEMSPEQVAKFTRLSLEKVLTLG